MYRFEGGYRINAGDAAVVHLYGSWFDMGRQYGKLLKEELAQVSDFAGRIANASAANHCAAERILALHISQQSHTLGRFREGACETSGLTPRELALANAVEYIAGLPLCSAMAVWDDYARDELIFGRNYDYGKEFLALNRDVAVTVFHPADGALSGAIIGYAGEVYAVNGMNETGLFLELNNATPSTRMAPADNRLSGTSLLFDALFRADGLGYLDRLFETCLCDDSYIINAADGREARSYEWSQLGVRRGEGATPPGLLVSTNHYVNPHWPFPLPGDETSWQSLTRRKNLLALAEREKGRITAESMMRLLDLSVEDGGAADDFTVYRLVAVPTKRRLFLKVTGGRGWTEIPLWE